MAVNSLARRLVGSAGFGGAGRGRPADDAGEELRLHPRVTAIEPHPLPHTGMPTTGVSERDARDIAAYLYVRGR